MQSHILYSLLGLGLLGQLSTAAPLDLRHETRSPQPGPIYPSLDTRKPGEGPIKCNSNTKEKYIVRSTIKKVIEDDFCKVAVKQGRPDKGSTSITRKRYTGSPSEIEISMSWEPSLDFKPNYDDCSRIMMEITDSCDQNESHYKGGGEKSAFGVKYQWKPTGERKSWAGCEWSYNGLMNNYRVWGSGWARDEGKKFHNRIKRTGLAANNFMFQWEDPEGSELWEDGREWTSTFQLILGSGGNIENDIESFVGNNYQVACTWIPNVHLLDK